VFQEIVAEWEVILDTTTLYIVKGIVPETVTEELGDASTITPGTTMQIASKIKPPSSAHFFTLNISPFLKYRFVPYLHQWYFG
jgi:hypothetical protein